ncbi:hypothetical protein [Enterococcus faecalis]|uniref:hypothetical protein n=1 Tax=Enterococcus faecalis TaxID=1351 RepID=UPI00032FE730|nr:hypothetical protein [Enterococcus faecalis]EOK37533.1 hypothetical protein WUI_02976 [Enterococcus faecalis EnGen0335]EOL91776.1 hypothetical protein WM1_02947 [Enterococcus faecalis EnGen0341]
MEKLVQVIKLRPGEAVLIVVEDNPAPCPYGMCGMGATPDPDDEHFPHGILLCLDDAAQEGAMCYVTIFDGSGKPITVEVSREIYQVFADYEREMERQRKEEYRHQGLLPLPFVSVRRKGQYMDGFIFIYTAGIPSKKVWHRPRRFKII